MRINGETQGLKSVMLEALDTLYDLRLPKDCLWTKELIDAIAYVSSEINREISVYVDRRGRVNDVSVGNNRMVSLVAVEGKRNSQHLSGTRCIHTHPSGTGQLSSVDISSLKILRFDAMIAVGVRDGKAHEMYAGILSPNPDQVDIYGPYAPDNAHFGALLTEIANADKTLRQTLSGNEKRAERAILVGLHTQDTLVLNGVSEAEVSCAELEELARTAGALVVGRLMQKRETRKSATLIGKGKIEELRLLAQALEADLVIFDEELTGAQQRNIENTVGVNVLSRTSLILDIFAQRAHSREGILQVELAQMEYRLPRLLGMGLTLSRLAAASVPGAPGKRN